VVSLSGNQLVVRNRIYERVFDQAWVAQHMPDAELRRQRAAYRRGLLRAAAVATALLALVGGVSLKSVRKADLTRLLYDVNINFAQQRYETADVGQALSLLDETRPKPGQPDLRGFEWYYLWRLCHPELRSLGRDLNRSYELDERPSFATSRRGIASPSSEDTPARSTTPASLPMPNGA